MERPDMLYSEARNLAEEHGRIVYKRSVNRDFLKIEEDSRILLNAYREINEQVKGKQEIIPAAEWLLDNFYMVEEQSKQIQHELPRNFRELPILELGIPRVYEIAEGIVSYRSGQLEEEPIIGYLKEYQSVTPLNNGELWILPLMIKVSLIKKIRERAADIVEYQKQKNHGRKWGALLVEKVDAPGEELQTFIMEHDREVGYMLPSYAEGMLRVFRDSGSKGTSLLTWLDGKLALQGTNADELIQTVREQQSDYQVSIGNYIISLKFLLSIRWEEIFEELSSLDHILNQDPSGFYSKMEFTSRNYYRTGLVKIARKYGVSELE